MLSSLGECLCKGRHLLGHGTPFIVLPECLKLMLSWPGGMHNGHRQCHLTWKAVATSVGTRTKVLIAAAQASPTSSFTAQLVAREGMYLRPYTMLASNSGIARE